MKAIQDPALYRKLSEPVESVDEAARLGNEFYEEVSKLREKYHVTELVMAFGINAKKENSEVFVAQTAYRGGQKTDNLILQLVQQTRFGKALLTFVDEITAAAFDIK